MVKSLFLIIILGAGYLFYSQYKTIDKLKAERVILQIKKKEKNTTSTLSKDKIIFQEKKSREAKLSVNMQEQLINFKKKKTLSLAVINFMKESYLQLILPGHYSYSYFHDFKVEGKDVVILQGIADLSSINILAARYIAKSVQELLVALSENSYLFAGINIQELLFLSKSQLSYYSALKGFKRVSVLSYKLNRKTIYAGYVKRVDLQGSYLILVSSSSVQAKTTFLEILRSLKVR